MTTTELRELMVAATPGPWEWWTSCSWRRLSQVGGKEGGVMYPYVASDGHPDICISEADMALIAALVNSAEALLCKADKWDAVRAIDAETFAKFFHKQYEELAPHHGYETKPESKVPFDELPLENRSLMVHVCAEVLQMMEQAND